MKATDTLRWGTKGIKQRKLRAALTILGIMIGTAAIIALTSQTQGIQVSIIGEIDKLGSNSITMRPASSSVILTQQDVGIISQIPGVSDVIPMQQAAVRLYGSGGARAVTLIGLSPADFNKVVPDADFSEGRMYTAESYSEIVIGSNVKNPQDMTTPFLNVGQSVSMEFGSLNPVRKEMQVVGSLAPYGVSMISVDDSAFITSSGFVALTGRTTYNSIFIKTSGPNADSQVTEYLKAIYGTSVLIVSVSQITQIVSTITGLLTVLFGAIAGISLFVAGVGIANIMFVSVVERTKEIGVLKALGFKSRHILSLFLSEAGILGIIGGALGIVAGVGISFMVPILFSGSMGGGSFNQTGGGGFGGPGTSGQFGSSFSYSPVFNPELIFGVFLFAVALSVIAGLYPARRASKMDPVVALRHE